MMQECDEHFVSPFDGDALGGRQTGPSPVGKGQVGSRSSPEPFTRCSMHAEIPYILGRKTIALRVACLPP